MKKKPIVILITVIICLLLSLVLYQYLIKKPYLDSSNIDRISITLLQETSVNHLELTKEEIVEFERLYNKNDFKPSLHKNDKGWEIMVNVTGSPNHTISILGDYMKFDGIWYATNGNLKEDILDLVQ